MHLRVMMLFLNVTSTAFILNGRATLVSLLDNGGYAPLKALNCVAQRPTIGFTALFPSHFPSDAFVSLFYIQSRLVMIAKPS